MTILLLYDKLIQKRNGINHENFIEFMIKKTDDIRDMITYEYGNKEAKTVLIQPVDDPDLLGIENEVNMIRELAGADFRLIAVKVGDWNRDLSPWKAPAVFGKEGFGGGAADTLSEILSLTDNREKTYYIGGYSLAGLFALWTVYRTDVFSGIAAASPSVWFPGFTDFVKSNQIKCSKVYLSLGDKEEKAKNPVMATVGDCIREIYGVLKEQNIDCTLECNQGNHFKDVDLRTAKAFAWLIGK